VAVQVSQYTVRRWDTVLVYAKAELCTLEIPYLETVEIRIWYNMMFHLLECFLYYVLIIPSELLESS
jgi:hypothetical protein